MQCTPYAPGLGETCDTIASRLGLTKPQLVSWNPEVGPLCGNIGKLASKNMVLCASNPGGSWVDPSPGEDAPTSTTTAYTLVVTNSGSAFSLFPSATAQATLLPNENYVTPFANASWENCEVYATPPVVMDLANGTVSYACEDVAAAYGITMDELLLWNPGINTTGGFDVPCELSFMFQYCVQPTLTLAADTVPECIFPALAPPAWTCDVFAQRYNISKAAVAAWNPSVGTDCSEFIPGMFLSVLILLRGLGVTELGQETHTAPPWSITSRLVQSRPAVTGPWPMTRPVSSPTPKCLPAFSPAYCG